MGSITSEIRCLNIVTFSGINSHGCVCLFAFIIPSGVTASPVFEGTPVIITPVFAVEVFAA